MPTSLRPVLNRLLATQTHSFIRYVAFADPWRRAGDEPTSAALRLIAAGQKHLAERIGEHIVERFGRVDGGSFPMEYTSVHDLSFEFLLPLAIEHEKGAIAVIERCAELLKDDPVGGELAQEALGEAKGHLESLQELTAGPKAAHVG